MFDVPPKCPALADKLTGLFNWRHTYRVHEKHKGLLNHGLLQKSYSLNLPRTMNSVQGTGHNSFMSVKNVPINPEAEPDSWVIVHHLQSQSGILDPDDRVRDVADDREQIIASFEDGPGPEPSLPQGGGDGASGGSSVGTGSPDIFRGSNRASNHNLKRIYPSDSSLLPPNHHHHLNNDLNKSNSEIIIPNGGLPRSVNHDDDDYTPHIEVTEILNDDMVSGLGLQVRRSSDPSLNNSDANPANASNQSTSLYNNSSDNLEKTKRWSAAPVCRGLNDESEQQLTSKLISHKILNNSSRSHHLSPPWEQEDHNESHHTLDTSATPSASSFSRSGRLSMQFLGEGTGFRWMDAAEKIANQHQQTNHLPVNGIYQQNQQSFNSKSLPRELKRKEPLGQAYESIREKDGEMLLIINENGGPLGLTAIPDVDMGGLLVQAVEIGSRAEKGRLKKGDRILEINGTKLVGMSDNAIQDCLRKSLNSSELRMRVMRQNKGKAAKKKDTKTSEMVELAGEKSTAKVATISPTRKVPGAPVATSLQVANTRKLGRKIEIALRKGPQGLGFSVTTRDNPAGGHCPIYIKNILPRGAAIEDGKLKPGDRLLEVDGVPMTGKAQSEVVGILRATQPGATVHIVVSRQQELAEMDEREIGHVHENENDGTPPKPPPPVLPQKPTKSPKQRSDSIKDIKDINFIQESAGSDSTSSNEGIPSYPLRNREVLTFHIPVHDTEKAGLGVSVKGKTGSSHNGSANTSTPNNSGASSSNNSYPNRPDGDLGIFVKSVLHGGAASRDGRLRMNDQLLSVNGISLLGQTNAEAMETLRRAMYQTGGNYPGVITLTIARKSGRPLSSVAPDGYECGNNENQSNNNAGSTVIYLGNNTNSAQNLVNKPEGSNNFSKMDQQQHQSSVFMNGGAGDSAKLMNCNDTKRWSNPVLNRLTGNTNHPSHGGGTGHMIRPSPLAVTSAPNGLRNDSYYMATVDNWSPIVGPNGCGHNTSQNMMHNSQINNSVLIEEDPEPTSPTSPTIPIRPNQITKLINEDLKQYQRMNSSNSQNSITSGDVTYASQLSLENPSGEAFSRDAIGRRSISEKHHAALDARETGTYQRNKKLREERERERQTQGGSIESLANQRKMRKHQELLRQEALDRVTDLGPSLGLKKSSSLESLQTMVQEIQMADEPRGPISLRTPRGRGREESLRAAVERPPESQPRKHWLLEDGPSDLDGGFANHNRNNPLQSSLNAGKHKSRGNANKKPGLLKGIGHMFRFGKHRKDGIAPAETMSDFGQQQSHQSQKNGPQAQPQQQIYETVNKKPSSDRSNGPPMYQPPPAPQNGTTNSSSGISQNDLFNARYSHYMNYDELQHQISSPNKQVQAPNDQDQQQHHEHELSESTLAQMRQQVMQQRVKVEEESRRHQHYHSQRSTRTVDGISSGGGNSNGLGANNSNSVGPQSNTGKSNTISGHVRSQSQHSQSNPSNSQSNSRPISSFYEFEVIHQHHQMALSQPQNGTNSVNSNSGKTVPRKMSAPSPPSRPQWNGGGGGVNVNGGSVRSNRSGGPFVTQVQIQQQQQQQYLQHQNVHNISVSGQKTPASKV